MFKNVLSFFAVMFLMANTTTAQVYSWAYSAGGNGWDDVKSTHLGTDNGTVLTGMFSSTATFGAVSLTSMGYQDAFVAKYDQMGNLLWANAISGNEQDWGYKVTTDNQNNVIVVGYFQSTALYFTPTDSLVKNALSSRNVFTAKYSSTGVFQWARLGSGGNTNAYLTARSVSTDNQNNVIISGDYNKQIEFNGSMLPQANAAIFLVKYDAAGNVLWAKAGVSTAICWFADLTSDAANNIYATGKISKPITFGAVTTPNIEGDDLVIAKFTPAGDLTWMKVEGKPILSTTTDNNFDCGVGIKVDAVGNIFVGGSLLDTTYYDANLNMLVIKQWICITKYNSSGTQLWLKKYGNDAKDVINAIDLDANGDVYAIGTYKGVLNVGAVSLPTANNTAAFVAKFNSSDGSTAFAYQHGVSAAEVNGYGIRINHTTGNVYTAGNYNGACSFNNNTLNPAGVWDIYLVLLNNTVAQGTADEEKNNLIALYPNPATDFLNIKTRGMDLANSTFKIYSFDGGIIKTGTLDANHKIDVSALAEGNYILDLYKGEDNFRQYFVKY